MRTILFMLFISIYSFSQNVPTKDEAQQYLAFLSERAINDFGNYEPTDTIYKLLDNYTVGDIIINNYEIYEIIKEEHQIPVHSAGYIYFDGNELSLEKINILRKEIIKKFSQGTPFKDLAAKYTMDKNPNAADLQFSDGEMVYEFENAVKSHKAGQIFTIDIPERQWYYIAIRNPENSYKKVITARYAIYPH